MVNLADILSPDQIVPKLSATDRWNLIDALVDVLVRTGKIRPEDRQVVSTAVKDREATKSTGIGYGIAMPHASVPCVQQVVAVLARVQPAIDFQALDNQPVSICVLLLTPQGEFQQNLQTLSAFARFFSDKTRRQQLEAAGSAEEIFALLRPAATAT
jgi:mannitol/fructose-specific phosphotransferase system IIA component (Ntr-type)